MEEGELSELKKREHNKGAKIKIIFPLPFCLYLKDGEYIINQNGEEIVLSLEKKNPETFDSRLGIELLKPDKIEDNKEYLAVRVSNVVEESKKTYTLTRHDLEKLKTKKDIMYLLDKKPEKLIKGSELKAIKEGYWIIGTVSEERNFVPPPCVLYMNCERRDDRRGFFRYTEVAVLMAHERTNVMDSNFWGNIMDRSLNAINRLIEVYRYMTGDYYVERLTKEDINVVRKHGEMEIYLNNEKITQPWEMYPKLVPFIEVKNGDVHRKLKEFLVKDIQIPIVDHLLLNAKDFLQKENYKMAIIESVTALEPTVEDFVKNKLSSMKISNNKIDGFMEKVTLSPRVGVMLKLFVDPNQFKHTIIDEISSTIKIRNKIVHEERIRVDKGEAEKAVKNIENLINFLATIKMQKQQLREKIREEREREWIREALRARKFSGIETFEQGLSLIDFAMRIAKNAKHRRNT